MTAVLQGEQAARSPAGWDVRSLDRLDDYRQCERLQEAVWGRDDVAGVPLLDLMTARENGGVVLGAFSGEGRLMGFVYSFPGIHAGSRLKQCSVLLGVHPAFRGLGVGVALKRAQGEATLALGMDLITWTFDPLLSLNAHLNIARLGGVAREYRVNLYDSGNGLNSGLDTDRLVVEWWLRRSAYHDPRAPHRAPRRGLPPANAMVNEVGADPVTGLPRVRRVELDRDSDCVLVQVPADVHAVKRHDLDLARHWRASTRAVLQEYLGRGYVAVDYLLPGCIGELPCYLLRRRVSR